MTTATSRQRTTSVTAVELKGSVFTLPILQIQTTDITAIESELVLRLSSALKFFENAPIVIDLKMIRNEPDSVDFHELMKLLSQQRLIPVGVKNGSSQQNSLAVSAGLAVLKDGISQQSIEDQQNFDKSARPEKARTVKAASEKRAVAANASEEPVANQAAQVLASTNKTKIVTQPVRSGQQIYAKGGDLIIMAPVNHGAEIIADGNIHVYSTMRGRALAGVRGDESASIFCQSMEAELVAIAGNFRVFEEAVPAEIKSKSVRIHLDNEQLVISQL